MFGVSLPNTEHQLVFLQHQYQQLHQENMFYQTCIKNQQQLEELKAKKNPRTPPAEKKNRRTPLATKNNKVPASELQKTPPTLKPYYYFFYIFGRVMFPPLSVFIYLIKSRN